MTPKPGPTLWTIGHSNRTSEALVALLEEAGMKCLVDIRRVGDGLVYDLSAQLELPI